MPCPATERRRLAMLSVPPLLRNLVPTHTIISTQRGRPAGRSAHGEGGPPAAADAGRLRGGRSGSGPRGRAKSKQARAPAERAAAGRGSTTCARGRVRIAHAAGWARTAALPALCGPDGKVPGPPLRQGLEQSPPLYIQTPAHARRDRRHGGDASRSRARDGGSSGGRAAACLKCNPPNLRVRAVVNECRVPRRLVGALGPLGPSSSGRP